MQILIEEENDMRYLTMCLAIVALLTPPISRTRGQTPDSTKLIHIPRYHARLIETHLAKINANDWGRVEPSQLDHCHILLSPASKDKVFSSVEELFSYSVAILYHSDERLDRWLGEEGNLPVEKRHPRSIIGWPDGTVVPAAALIKNTLNEVVGHERNGSIRAADLARELPNLFTERRTVSVESGSGNCGFTLQIDISTAHDGEPEIYASGARWKTTMDCF